jgi:hypothetical protein
MLIISLVLIISSLLFGYVKLCVLTSTKLVAFLKLQQAQIKWQLQRTYT